MQKAIAFAMVVALAACNTVAGLGQDVSGGAHAVQDMLN